jgi:acyl-coenzyme A thioesterase 7
MPLLGGVGYEVVSGLLLSSLLVYRARRRRRRRRRRPSALMPHPPPTLADAAGLGAAGEDGFRTTLTRLMLPDDANPAGNVHGGTILKMMELSAFIIAARHVNGGAGTSAGADRRCVGVVLASIQHCSFLKPMKIGDVAHVRARIIGAHSSSLEISVKVYRECLGSHDRDVESTHRAQHRGSSSGRGASRLQLTNTSRLWYVQVSLPPKAGGSGGRMSFQLAPGLRPLSGLSRDELLAGEARYKALKSERAAESLSNSNTYDAARDPTDVVIARLMLPSDCSSGGLVFGGVLSKMMDSGAGVTCGKHCRSNCVTVSMENFRLLSPTRVGDHVSIRTRIVFTSSRTMEIEAIATRVDRHSASTDGFIVVCCARARFIFVALQGSKVCKMPAWTPKTEYERKLAAQARQRYVLKKESRAAAKKGAQGSG